MAYENIIYEKEGRIARLTLNRPEVLNALSFALLDEMDAALIEAEQDDEVGVIIFKGAGRAFSAGYDIEPEASGYRPLANPVFDDMLRLQELNRKVTAIWDIRKPVIAQVHGYCIAGGNDIAGQCDITVAAENAIIGYPEIRRLGVPWLHMATYHAGLQWTKILSFTGDFISGKQAERIGLVAKAVPEGELEEEVNKLAQRIALVPPELLALNKAAINRVVEEMGLRNGFNASLELDTIAHFTKAVLDFEKMSEEKGLKAALAVNEAPFKALPKPFEEKPNL